MECSNVDNLTMEGEKRALPRGKADEHTAKGYDTDNKRITGWMVGDWKMYQA